MPSMDEGKTRSIQYVEKIDNMSSTIQGESRRRAIEGESSVAEFSRQKMFGDGHGQGKTALVDRHERTVRANAPVTSACNTLGNSFLYKSCPFSIGNSGV